MSKKSKSRSNKDIDNGVKIVQRQDATLIIEYILIIIKTTRTFGSSQRMCV